MLGAQYIMDQLHLDGVKDQVSMLGLVSRPHPPRRLYLLHLVDPVEEVPVMVSQLACQVLGTH